MTASKCMLLRKALLALCLCSSLALGIITPFASEAQSKYSGTDSCQLRISLLTCTPGKELYSIFGHTAIRVVDNENDLVFNYGTFNFNDPDFYAKFVRGKLDYFLSVEAFTDFVYGYQWEQRGITEQVLSLNCQEKHRLFERLIRNAQEANKFYKYDFLFDNCTTRAGDMIRKDNDRTFITKNILQGPPPTFRELLHEYLDKGGLVWSKLGIDILLGSRIDRTVNNAEFQFLPDNLMRGMDSTAVDGISIVNDKSVILKQAWTVEGTAILPLWWTLSLAAIIFLFSWYHRHTYSRWQSVFDHIFFSLLGLLGCLLVFMWWGTDHASCRDNFNLLWCLPFSLAFIWLPNKFQAIRKKYFLVQTAGLLILMVCWKLLPQQMNIALLPIVLLTAMRSWMIAKNGTHFRTV